MVGGGGGARVGGCPARKNNFSIFPLLGGPFSPCGEPFFFFWRAGLCSPFGGSFSPFRGGGLFSLCGEIFKLVSTYKISAGVHALAAKIVINISPWGKLREIVRHIKSVNTFWSTYSYDVEKINVMIR